MYFQYNGKHYKQLHGTAMGSPVSVVVAEIVMQNIEEQALATYTRTIPIWLRYVDDTFTAVHKDGIDDFHEHLNRQNADIQFTKEIKENGKIPFLDCLVTRDNNKLQTTIYRKPTHTDRLLDQSSYNPTSHKATTIRTLTRRAQLVCDSPDSLQDETNYLNNVLVRTITTRTLLDGTLAVTLIPTLRPTSTQAIKVEVFIHVGSEVKENFLSGMVKKGKRKETLATKTTEKKKHSNRLIRVQGKASRDWKVPVKVTQLLWVALNFLESGLWTVKKAISEIIYSAWQKAFINIDKIYLSRKLIIVLLQR